MKIVIVIDCGAPGFSAKPDQIARRFQHILRQIDRDVLSLAVDVSSAKQETVPMALYSSEGVASGVLEVQP